MWSLQDVCFIMDLNVAKSIILLGLFGVTFLLTMVPLKIVSVVQRTLDPQRRRFYKNVISLLNCFGGGVFLGACLLDLFPEVRDELSGTFDQLQIVTSFPMSEFVMVFGFFMAFIVEQIVLSWQDNRTDGERQPLLQRSVRRGSGSDGAGLDVQSYRASHSLGNHSFDTFHSDSEKHSTLRSVVLMLALSLHSLFEGFAIGLQPGLPELAQLLAAVAIHKCIIAFSLGLNLVQSKLTLRTIVMLNLTFSITTPLGIAAGMAIVDLSQSIVASLVSGILQGIACGTFLFVTFFEVLPHEMNSSGARLPKVLATLVGFAAVCGALFLDPAVERPSCYREAEPVPKP